MSSRDPDRFPAHRRRAWLAAVLAATLGLGCAAPGGPAPIPVVFVHGNGDSAALWTTTLWRFESNGWPRERLHAIDMPLPSARDHDAVAQPGRSSATEFAQHLAAEVDAVLARTGASQVALVGNSRGGNAIRHYVQNLGGAAKVSHAVLGGVPSHGVWADPAFLPGSEFNGAGAFLQQLNAPKGPAGDEVTPGVRWMTIRSDRNDKYAQPDGVWIGRRGQPTNVSYDGPALKGAHNVVLPGRDHREVSYHADAFAETFRFIAGRAPASVDVRSEPRVVLDGRVSAPGTNLPLPGATIEVHAVDAATGERQGPPLHRRTVGADGRWGPLALPSTQPIEFVLSAAGYATSHVYRGPFPRSSSVVHLRAERVADADRDAAAVVTLVRPRGYFGLPRDRITLDGRSPAPGIPPGVAGVASSKVKLGETGRAVAGEYTTEGGRTERLVGRAWPLAENHLVTLELTW